MHIMLLMSFCSDQQCYSQMPAFGFGWDFHICRLTHLLIHLEVGRWIVIPVLIALLFLLPEKAIAFHSSRVPCCTRVLPTMWPQFKA